MASKMNGVPPQEVLGRKRGNGDHLAAQLLDGTSDPREVLLVGKDREIGIATKLRRAVEHASLTAHQQGAHLAVPENRKDFANRVRDQGCLLGPGIEPRVSRFHAIVPMA
jgi:hypothetical protein